MLRYLFKVHEKIEELNLMKNELDKRFISDHDSFSPKMIYEYDFSSNSYNKTDALLNEIEKNINSIEAMYGKGPSTNLDSFVKNILINGKASPLINCVYFIGKHESGSDSYISGANVSAHGTEILTTTKFSKALFFTKKRDAKNMLLTVKNASRESNYRVITINYDRLHEINATSIRVEL